MTDRELLELAAKAVGYDTTHTMNAERLLLDPPVAALLVRKDGELVTTGWDPLNDDGHALQLAVKLGFLQVVVYGASPGYVCVTMGGREFAGYFDDHTNDAQVLAATRRAITSAAARIGLAMP